MDLVSNDLAAKIKSLEECSDNELYAIMGTYSLSEHPEQLTEIMVTTKGMKLPSFEDVINMGRKFMEQMNPIMKETICSEGGVNAHLEDLKLLDVITFVLTALGYPTAAKVPMAVVAAVYFIVKGGIRLYCKGYTKPTAAQA